MPELPRQLRREVQTNPALQDREREGRYAELHCRSNFSFLEGASHPDELVNRAAELGLSALAVTDRNSLAGVVRAHVAAKAAPLFLAISEYCSESREALSHNRFYPPREPRDMLTSRGVRMEEYHFL